MYYAIHHTTTFHYSQPITESVMELRLEPRGDLHQRCLRFQIVLSPKARTNHHRDYNGNVIHTFDIPGRHEKLAITTESIVEILPAPELPAALSPEDWRLYDTLQEEYEFF